jgi:hypothetical protein
MEETNNHEAIQENKNEEIKSKYTPARIKANKKWCEANKEHMKDYHREYKKRLYDENPEFREKKRIQNLERYHKKKELLKQQNVEILGN